MATMRIVENNQSKLKHCIDKTKRFLRRARDFYVDSMVRFEGKVSCTNVVVCPAIHISHLPSDLGRRSSIPLNDRENLDRFYRSISEKYSGKTNMGFDEVGEKRSVAAMDRSYSVALGRIGTIDEEEPCDFRENVAIKSDILFSRCRSHAVAWNNGFY